MDDDEDDEDDETSDDDDDGVGPGQSNGAAAGGAASSEENLLQSYVDASNASALFLDSDPNNPFGDGLGPPRKRERSNAKAVECFDMDGNRVDIFRSGMAASQKLNIPQGDISLCCRGLKVSVLGYKFRFFGDTEDRQAAKLKKGFALESVAVEAEVGRLELTRTTRASRGEYGPGARNDPTAKSSILIPPHLKTRNWNNKEVKAGPFTIKRWVPAVPKPTQELQDHLPKLGDRKNKKGRKSMMSHRQSIE
ncbi:hypothetical protein B484DRAFT_452869 [Ochromonadaceae sp. CCMP2298]|nr:hypothetical protein B484DRAFT_452869 [Ochromonadaceae sp. CCMP2298]